MCFILFHILPAGTNGKYSDVRSIMQQSYLSQKADALSIFDMGDEEILELSLSHPSVFEVIVDRYQDRFLKKAKTVLHNEEDAEDAVQETMVRIYRYAHTFREQQHASFSSWAYKILFNTSFTLYQKKKKRFLNNPSMEHEFCDLAGVEDHEAFQMMERFDITRVLGKMPEMLASVLEKHFLLGFSQKEIAAAEGVPVGTIKARVHRAKKEFRKINSTFS